MFVVHTVVGLAALRPAFELTVAFAQVFVDSVDLAVKRLEVGFAEMAGSGNLAGSGSQPGGLGQPGGLVDEPTVVKLELRGDVRRVRLRVVTLAALREAVSMNFGELVEHGYVMKYLDEEGDRCTLMPETFLDFEESVAAGETAPKLIVHARVAGEPCQHDWVPRREALGRRFAVERIVEEWSDAPRAGPGREGLAARDVECTEPRPEPEPSAGAEQVAVGGGAWPVATQTGWRCMVCEAEVWHPTLQGTFYGVRGGPRYGVYTSWAQAADAAQGISGAVWKKFRDLGAARAFAGGRSGVSGVGC